MDLATRTRKSWCRPRNIILGSIAIILVITGWVVYETAAVMRSVTNPTVNYAQSLRELSEQYVSHSWDPNRAEEAWRHLEEARDRSDSVLAELTEIMRADPERYPPRFEFDTSGPDLDYIRFGRVLPADIGREPTDGPADHWRALHPTEGAGYDFVINRPREEWEYQ